MSENRCTIEINDAFVLALSRFLRVVIVVPVVDSIPLPLSPEGEGTDRDRHQAFSLVMTVEKASRSISRS